MGDPTGFSGPEGTGSASEGVSVGEDGDTSGASTGGGESGGNTGDPGVGASGAPSGGTSGSVGQGEVGDPSASPDGGGDGGDGRVICTELNRIGMLSDGLWKADVFHSATRISPLTINGYQTWAIPYVRLMRRYKWAARIVAPLARARAEEVAYQIGRRAQPNFGGKLVRIIGEPICWLIGVAGFIPEDYRVLYDAEGDSRQVG
jgi:hypothetical protein